MAGSFEPDYPARRSGAFRKWAAGLTLAFLGGLALMAWALTRWEPLRQIAGIQSTAEAEQTTPATPKGAGTPGTSAPANALSAPAQTAAQMQAQTQAQAIADDRVDALETRMARLDVQASAAASNAGRAEGLLVAFAARRAIDRGAGLGYIEGQLRERFGDTQPRAVAAVIAAAQQPVTLASLRQQLDLLGPDIATRNPQESWWGAAQRTLSSLFIVRKERDGSPAPDQRLARARLMIDGGQVDGALAEVARLPGRGVATDWMNAARRYVEAHRALDIIEAAAIMPDGVAPAVTPAKPTAPATGPVLVVPPASGGATNKAGSGSPGNATPSPI